MITALIIIGISIVIAFGLILMAIVDVQNNPEHFKGGL